MNCGQKQYGNSKGENGQIGISIARIIILCMIKQK